MNREIKNKQIRLDEFNNVSLHQLMPCGNGLALKKLKTIVNSILNGQAQRETNKPLSILISGESAKRTHALALCRALGLEDIRLIPASFLQNPSDLIEYIHNSSADTGHIISNLNLLPSGMYKKMHQILNEGAYTSHNFFEHKKEVFPVMGIIIATIRDAKLLPDILRDSFDYEIELQEYLPEQKKLVCLQRLKYAGIDIQSDDVLKTLLLFSPSGLNDLMKLLRLSIVVMMSEGRDLLTSIDVQKGKELW